MEQPVGMFGVTLCLLISGALVACGDCGSSEDSAPGDEGEPPPSPGESSEAPDGEGSGSPAEPAAKGDPNSDADVDRAGLREVREQVMRARRLAKRGRHDGALEVFEQLIAESERAPRLRCEAGFIAYRAGDLDRASELLDEGLRQHGPLERVPSTQRRSLAQCLYNYGLVAEAQGHRAKAKAAYRHSLELRANATVQRRLDALGEVSSDDVEQILDRGMRPPSRQTAPTLAALHGTLGSRVCAEIVGASMMHNDGVYTWEPTGCRHREMREAVADEYRAHVVMFRPVHEAPEDGYVEKGVGLVYVALESDDGAVGIGPIASTDSAGWYQCDIELSRIEWVETAATPLLVIDVVVENSLTEMGCSFMDAYRTVVLCSASPARCAELRFGSHSTTTCVDEEEEEHMPQGGPAVYAATVSVGDGAMRLSWPEGSRRFELRELLEGCDLTQSPLPDDCDLSE